jgi:hypothetical protein
MRGGLQDLISLLDFARLLLGPEQFHFKVVLLSLSNFVSFKRDSVNYLLKPVDVYYLSLL